MGQSAQAEEVERLLLRGAERFGVDAGDVGDNERLCAFLTECIEDDERYAQFMGRLREHRRFAGFSCSCKKVVAAFLFYLTRFSADTRDAALRGLVAHCLRATLVSLEHMREGSLVRRDLTDDFMAAAAADDDDTVAIGSPS